jgi:hypothetical protein
VRATTSLRASWLDAGWLDAVVVLAAKLAASAVVLRSGFHAISDDDYARLVIAQRFADSPALDPSGSSWLPLPFWIYGGGFALLGNGLEVARGLAVALGALSALLVWLAARVAGVGRAGALGAGIVAGIFPYSAYLGAAAVPEAPASALVVFGVSTLAGGPALRLLGALALCASCASRYEPWPAALAFAALTLRDATRSRDARFYLGSALAIGFPLAWLLHGSVRHDHALFFLERVSRYKAALGTDEPWLARLLRAPRGLLTIEPELVLACVTAGLLWARRKPRAPPAPALVRGSLCIAALFAALVAGEILGGAPTHHAERALLAVWFWCAVLTAFFVERVALERRELRLLLPSLLVSLLVATLLIRALFSRDGFADRRAELDLGARARQRHVERLAIDAADFGYFAIQASFGRPAATVVLDDRDPRKPRARDVLLEHPGELATQLMSRDIHWLAVPISRVSAAKTIASERERNQRWALLELRR